MKFIFTALFLSATLAQASVDYVEIGEALSSVNQSLANVKSSVACHIKRYDQDKTLPDFIEVHHVIS